MIGWYVYKKHIWRKIHQMKSTTGKLGASQRRVEEKNDRSGGATENI